MVRLSSVLVWVAVGVGVGWVGYILSDVGAKSLAKKIQCFIPHERRNESLSSV